MLEMWASVPFPCGSCWLHWALFSTLCWLYFLCVREAEEYCINSPRSHHGFSRTKCRRPSTGPWFACVAESAISLTNCVLLSWVLLMNIYLQSRNLSLGCKLSLLSEITPMRVFPINVLVLGGLREPFFFFPFFCAGTRMCRKHSWEDDMKATLSHYSPQAWCPKHPHGHHTRTY